jgi:hypothetical protein
MGRAVVTHDGSLRRIHLENVEWIAGMSPPQEANMVFDKTDTKLSGFINEGPPEDLSGIASLLFTRVGALEPSQQERFIQDIRRDPSAKRVFEKMQAYSR